MEIDTGVSNESGVAAAVHAGKEIILASKRGLLTQQGSLYTLRDDGSIHIERELSDEIDKRNARPVYLRGAARVLDEASLIAHALRNKAQMVVRVKEATKLPAFAGSPES